MSQKTLFILSHEQYIHTGSVGVTVAQRHNYHREIVNELLCKNFYKLSPSTQYAIVQAYFTTPNMPLKHFIKFFGINILSPYYLAVRLLE